jgi:hypothetical protein
MTAIPADKIRTVQAALVSLAARPDDGSWEYLSFLEALDDIISNDALTDEIDQLRHDLTPCEDCHRINCQCDAWEFHSERKAGGLWL